MIHPEVNFFHQSVKGMKLCPPLGLSIVNWENGMNLANLGYVENGVNLINGIN